MIVNNGIYALRRTEISNNNVHMFIFIMIIMLNHNYIYIFIFAYLIFIYLINFFWLILKITKYGVAMMNLFNSGIYLFNFFFLIP